MASIEEPTDRSRTPRGHFDSGKGKSAGEGRGKRVENLEKGMLPLMQKRKKGRLNESSLDPCQKDGETTVPNMWLSRPQCHRSHQMPH